MLKGVPKILSPKLLKILDEMGHSDVICIGDGNFPGARFAKEGNTKFIRADGHGVPELLDAILTLIPADEYVETPFTVMEVAPNDKGLDIPIIREYEKIVAKHDPRGAAAIGTCERFEYYQRAKNSYCILQSGEEAIYANIMIQKGVIK